MHNDVSRGRYVLLLMMLLPLRENAADRGSIEMNSKVVNNSDVISLYGVVLQKST